MSSDTWSWIMLIAIIIVGCYCLGCLEVARRRAVRRNKEKAENQR